MQEKLAQAIAYRTEKRFEEARQIFAELIRQNPDDAEVNYHYAWMHDAMGEETGAVPFYERAIESGRLNDEDLHGAMLGLGSTYRTIGEYQKSVEMLRRGMERFPETHDFKVFLAMALYNLKEYAEAMELLLNTAADTSNDVSVQRYARAIRFYANKLDETWI